MLEVEEVAADDDFFRLGGDSLMAESLMAELERRLKVTLSVSALVDAPTPRRLAARVAGRSAPRRGELPVALLRPGGRLPALFCVHGMSGTPVASLHIAESLQIPNAVYGLRAPGLEEGEQPMTTAASLAAHHLASIRAVQPTGPYWLLGHCGGSTIAYEMARMLIEAGESVDRLILIDPSTDRKAPFLYRSGLRLAVKRAKWAGARWSLLREIRAAGSPSAAERRALVNRAMVISIARYRPKPVDCPTLLIHTPARREALCHPVRGYPPLLPRGEFVEVGVPHSDLFTGGLASVCRACDAFLQPSAARVPASA
ncbi:MAG: hypothetical protein J0H94_02590 [Rhizobiales bacterium]|nr:hypothetical protein [Hyphomicrobiales bacterium]